MINLKDEILLYHGSYTEITSIGLSFSKRSLDFGRGFYLTSSYEQALNYIPSAVKKNIRKDITSLLKWQCFNLASPQPMNLYLILTQLSGKKDLIT